MDSKEQDTGTPSSRESYYGTSPTPIITNPSETPVQAYGSMENHDEYPQTHGPYPQGGPEAAYPPPYPPQEPYGRYDRGPSYSQNQPVNGMAIASLVLGILSLLTCVCAGIGGLIFGGFGILLAFLSRGNGPMQSPAKVGLGLSIAGVVLGFLAALICFGLVMSQDAYTQNGVLYQYEAREFP